MCRWRNVEWYIRKYYLINTPPSIRLKNLQQKIQSSSKSCTAVNVKFHSWTIHFHVKLDWPYVYWLMVSGWVSLCSCSSSHAQQWLTYSCSKESNLYDEKTFEDNIHRAWTGNLSGWLNENANLDITLGTTLHFLVNNTKLSYPVLSIQSFYSYINKH